MIKSHATNGHFDKALANYLECVDSGTPIDFAAICAEYPECEADLRRFASQEGNLHRAVAAMPLALVENMADQTLGDFRLLRELGRGGMGVVYEAEQISLGRRVALKILPFSAQLDKQQLARFKNEARAAATLDHPHIVAIHSVGSEGNIHYYAMQLISGYSLAEVIARLRKSRDPALPVPEQETHALSTADGPLTTAITRLATGAQVPLPETNGALGGAHASPEPLNRSSLLGDVETKEYYRTVARLGIEAAGALDHAHQSGILHRDIKPANLLLDETGKLWIADFGLARIEADAGMTVTGDILGTLRYMSPEQVLAQRAVLDHRSDIYSLGVTLYELLSLEPVFSETDRTQLLQQITQEDPRAPRQIDPLIPCDLETIVLKAMRKIPEERYSTALELADDLQRFLEDRPIQAKRPTRRERLVKWSRRHPAVVWAFLAVLSIAMVTLLITTVIVRQASRNVANQRILAEQARLDSEANLELATQALDQVITNERHRMVLSDKVLYDDTREPPLPTNEFWKITITLFHRLSDSNSLNNHSRLDLSRRLSWISKYYRENAPLEYNESILDILTLSMDLAERCVIEEPTDAESQRALRSAQGDRISFLANLKRWDEALTLIERNLEGCREWCRLSPQEGSARAFLADGYTEAMWVNESLGRIDLAYKLSCKALEEHELAILLNGDSLYYKIQRPALIYLKARALLALDRNVEGLALYRSAASIAKQTCEENLNSAEALRRCIDIHWELGLAFWNLRYFADAIAMNDQAAKYYSMLIDVSDGDSTLKILYARARCLTLLSHLELGKQLEEDPKVTIDHIEKLLDEEHAEPLFPLKTKVRHCLELLQSKISESPIIQE